ncbi:MAG: ornithine acetyltransferase [Pseudomonadota bacterium]
MTSVSARKVTGIVAALVLATAVGACGTTHTERAISGGAIGAGAGAVGAAVLGGSVGTAAVVGGAVGAVAGAVTDKSDIDLGDFPN